jgi:hypothetical protein
MNPAMTTKPGDVPFSGTEIANTVSSNTVSLIGLAPCLRENGHVCVRTLGQRAGTSHRLR